MSKYSEGIQYYLIVAAVGLVAASLSVAFYLVYFALWDFTQNAVSYSVLIFLPLAFLAIGLPNGEVSLKDTIVKPAAAILTIGLGGSAGPEGPSLLAGGGVASVLSRRFKVQADLRRRLFIAGAAAGLAATFRTPRCRRQLFPHIRGHWSFAAAWVNMRFVRGVFHQDLLVG